MTGGSKRAERVDLAWLGGLISRAGCPSVAIPLGSSVTCPGMAGGSSWKAAGHVRVSSCPCVLVSLTRCCSRKYFSKN